MVAKRSSRRTRRNRLNKSKKINRLNKSKKILRLRKKKYSKRKKSNVLKRNVLKRYKKQMGGAATGGEFLNRIGFELETCLTGKKVNTGFGTIDCLAINSPGEKIFDNDLNYFEMTRDGSIECHPDNCSMELVLKDNHTFNYRSGGIIYADGVDVTSLLTEEILIITSKANPCAYDSCGFHVHMSDTRPNHTLNEKDGKLFLLKALALWCGIEGITDGDQDTTFKRYVREPPWIGDAGFSDKHDKLNMEKFEDVYSKATNDSLSNLDLLLYLNSVYNKEGFFDNESIFGYHGYRYFAFNIYFLGEGDKKARESYVKKAKAHDKLDDPRKMYDIMLAEELWNKPLRIEFRGYKDLMDVVMDEVREPPDKYTPEFVPASFREHYPKGLPRPEPSVEGVKGVKRFVRASVFYEKLKDYLDTINDFFERAKVYDPLSY